MTKKRRADHGLERRTDLDRYDKIRTRPPKQRHKAQILTPSDYLNKRRKYSYDPMVEEEMEE